jgi:hypothetical protein
MTCRYFSKTIIPPTTQEFLGAETEPWAISKQLYFCSSCRSMWPLRHFTDDMRKGKRGRSGVDAKSRLCVKCGVNRQLHPPGSKLKILGQMYVVCKLSAPFTGRLDLSNRPEPYFPILRVERKRTTAPDSNGHYQSDDDWEYSTRLHVGGKHCGELYEALPDL